MSDIVNEAELIVAEADVKHTLNKGFKVCCPDCHSTDYEIYPTGQLGHTIQRPEEDIHWVCKDCGYIWSSEFLAHRYNYQKSVLIGQYLTRYKNFKDKRKKC